MTVRPLRPSDLPKLRALEFPEFPWEFGADFMGALVIADANDEPVMVAGAWKRAEVHLLADGRWSTPGARKMAFDTLHEATRQMVEAQNVGEVWTFMEGMRAFGRRLRGLGWGLVTKPVWARRIKNG